MHRLINQSVKQPVIQSITNYSYTTGKHRASTNIDKIRRQAEPKSWR